MQNNKSILIVGSGPSASYGQAGRLAKGCEVARTNWFFLEKQQIFGKQVDYLFHYADEALINYIYYVLNKNDDIYCIHNNIEFYYTSVPRYIKTMLKDKISKIDIYIGKQDLTFLYIHDTVGLRMLRYFLKSGYKTIYCAGLDFFQGEHQYLNTKNVAITKLCKPFMSLNIKAYDEVSSVHSLECDINALKDLLTQYPDVKITATSCHPETTKIWQQFKQVKVIEFTSHQMPELYDAYLDKPWLKKAVDDCARKYSFRLWWYYKIHKILNKVIKIVILLSCYVYLLSIIFPQ